MNFVLRTFRRFQAALRQRRFPKEFRIAPACWPAGLVELFQQLKEAVASQDCRQPHATSTTDSRPSKEQVHFLGELGTHLLRLRHKLVDRQTKQPVEETRRIYRHLESAWDTLAQAGVEIRDHTGEPFPENGVSSLKTLAFQPTAGIDRETVVETVRPTVYFRDKIIQIGEVVVAVPEKAQKADKPATELEPPSKDGSSRLEEKKGQDKVQYPIATQYHLEEEKPRVNLSEPMASADFAKANQHPPATGGN
jgi:hypothetical protein